MYVSMDAFCRDTEESLDDWWHVIVSLEKHEAENAQYFSKRSIPRDCETSVGFRELFQFGVVSLVYEFVDNCTYI